MEYVREAKLEDVKDLAPLLRPDDVEEIMAASGLTPEAALFLGVKLGKPSLTFIDPEGGVAGMFGATPTNDPMVGAVWLMSSDAIEKYPMHFLRRCRPWIDKLNDAYPVLTNYVDSRNIVHIKWLRWLGFNFTRLIPYGVSNLPFYEIVRVKR